MIVPPCRRVIHGTFVRGHKRAPHFPRRLTATSTIGPKSRPDEGLPTCAEDVIITSEFQRRKTRPESPLLSPGEMLQVFSNLWMLKRLFRFRPAREAGVLWLRLAWGRWKL